MSYVSKIAQKSGDIQSLSRQDLELIALALDLLYENNQFEYKDLDEEKTEEKEIKQQRLRGWGSFNNEQ